MGVQNLYHYNNTLYIKFNGKYHGFPSIEVVGNVCGTSPASRDVENIPTDELGFVMSPESTIVSADNGKVYLVTNKTRYWIKNPKTLAYYQLNGTQNSLSTYANIIFKMLPEGEEIVAPGSK